MKKTRLCWEWAGEQNNRVDSCGPPCAIQGTTTGHQQRQECAIGPSWGKVLSTTTIPLPCPGGATCGRKSPMGNHFSGLKKYGYTKSLQAIEFEVLDNYFCWMLVYGKRADVSFFPEGFLIPLPSTPHLSKLIEREAKAASCTYM